MSSGQLCDLNLEQRCIFLQKKLYMCTYTLKTLCVRHSNSVRHFWCVRQNSCVHHSPCMLLAYFLAGRRCHLVSLFADQMWKRASNVEFLAQFSHKTVLSMAKKTFSKKLYPSHDHSVQEWLRDDLKCHSLTHHFVNSSSHLRIADQHFCTKLPPQKRLFSFKRCPAQFFSPMFIKCCF